MITYVICEADGTIHSVSRLEEMPEAAEMETMIPEGGFFIDISGQEEYEEMDILDIHNKFQAGATRKRLVKRSKRKKIVGSAIDLDEA